MRITAVQGDITEQRVDAIVNAADTRMRGGGGVDGAIHRAGGIEVLQDCIDRFPHGLATGDAGWTTAGRLPATWVIHTVGPNYAAGQQDRRLLESCYRRALHVADELGARIVAFPLVSAGIYGWPERDAVNAAVRTIAATGTAVEEVRIVAFSVKLFALVEGELAADTPMKVLSAVRLLHERGYHGVRVLPGMSASGMSWRIAIAAARDFVEEHGSSHLRGGADAIYYSTSDGVRFGHGEVTVATPIEEVADLILAALPRLTADADDAEHVRWYAGMLDLCERHRTLPVAYSDSHDPPPGWEIGWGSGRSYPAPPA
ncbi:MAG: O-acetyl-ADP-ribose deacetylase [Actinobacteria bacterium]|nr:O-acetyl-ADP-ribose deacetylase [Actinomycetota bacterium]